MDGRKLFCVWPRRSQGESAYVLNDRLSRNEFWGTTIDFQSMKPINHWARMKTLGFTLNFHILPYI